MRDYSGLLVDISTTNGHKENTQNGVKNEGLISFWTVDSC